MTDPTTLRTALAALVQKWSDEAISAMSNGLTEQAVATEWCASDLRAVLATPAPAADPTTLRTALEALVGLVDCYGLDHYGGDWGCAECHPDSDMLVGGFQCGLHLARAVLATPAPAADEARCDGSHDFLPLTCSRCGVRGTLNLSIVGEGERLDITKTHPAPTPAPPTPPATEDWYHGDLTDAHIDRMLDPRTPATEPVAALGPSTKAGWALLSKEALNSRSFTLINAADIIAIEQEAAVPPPATEPSAALVEAFVNDEMMERLALALGGAASSMTEGEFTARLDAIVAAARAEVGLAEDRDRWKAEAEHQYALRASSGTLDGAWAEVERLLPEGWWMGGVQRYGGTWAAAVWGPAPAWDMARADGSTPVEALRNLAQALAARARRAGEGGS